MLEVLLIYCIITGVITGTVAHAKNRNGIGWAIVGFFLNLLAIIWIAIMPKLEE